MLQGKDGQWQVGFFWFLLEVPWLWQTQETAIVLSHCLTNLELGGWIREVRSVARVHQKCESMASEC